MKVLEGNYKLGKEHWSQIKAENIKKFKMIVSSEKIKKVRKEGKFNFLISERCR